jgi:hypothetical protein
MTHPRDYLPVLDRIEAALEATCDALMTLQSIEALPSIPNDPGRVHVAQAISQLRQAIDELRDAQAEGQTGLALGFVLAGDRREPGHKDPGCHSSPRRTA